MQENPSENYVIGVDFGTDSVRSVIVDSQNGHEIASAVYSYPQWRQGKYCDPAQNQFRQHPQDYIDGLETTIKEVLEKAGEPVNRHIKAISVDTTGSTPVAVNEQGTPLALTPEFRDNPNAMFILWKDHTAIREAERINRFSGGIAPDYLKYVGGIYSSEWYWAKLLHILSIDENVRAAAHDWIEHCDWIPFLLTGGKEAHLIKRSRCAAGHKALWATDFGGYPPMPWYALIDPLLAGFASRLPKETYSANLPAGTLSPEWAEKLGLSEAVIVGCGAFDAHMGAVGGQIEPYYLSKVMGTSTCDILVTPDRGEETIIVKGICGQVYGSVIPGMYGYEAGQSAFGDTYAWFKKLLEWPLTFLNDPILQERVAAKILGELNRQAAALPLNEDAELATDWLNGRRTPDADQSLQAALTGLSLASDAPRIFRALAEATCFGAKAIVGRFREEGIPVKGIIGIGGVARKSPYIMQLMADILQMPIRIHRHEHTCAHGAAMFAATAAGLYPNIETAMAHMGGGFDQEYRPDKMKKNFYERRYQRYRELGQFTAKEHSYAG